MNKMNVAEKTYNIDIQLSPISAVDTVDFENLQFGRVFTDHMFEANYKDGIWQDYSIKPLSFLQLHPATSALHYGQAIFEGLKAFKYQNGEFSIFRPDMNFKRLNKSARRMAIPELPEELFMEALFQLVRIEKNWIPDSEEGSLYIRPYIFATDDFIGIKPSDTFKFVIFCCPVSKYYSAPVKVYIQNEYVRAFPGGTGGVKAAGNYAATMEALKKIHAKGYNNILWTDGITHTRIQEIGTMNVFFQIGDTVITVPTDEGTILEGITRNSCIELVKEKGWKFEERDITVHELISAHENGILRDAFGTGTAATVAPIGAIGYQEKDYELPPVESRVVSNWLKDEIRKIRKGLTADRFGWMWKV